ncbi:MAG: molybdopterin-guanine dinucleotide biosynthesis protein B [Gammaproteobacteria bacterium]|nr:molybdopterin-guanine dinucleotide biosynthesis protein B [Gammaproteobacteria bacterium]
MITDHQGVPLLGFVAPSGTGKTALLTAVIPLLREAGLRVGCIKHTHHPFEIDQPGKDSRLLREAGAEQMLIGGAGRWALIVETDANAEPGLREMANRMLIDQLDLVLVEGFKLAVIPKIEVHRAELGADIACRETDSIIALATNQKPPPSVPVPILDLDNPRNIADFILTHVRNCRDLHTASTKA